MDRMLMVTASPEAKPNAGGRVIPSPVCPPWFDSAHHGPERAKRVEGPKAGYQAMITGNRSAVGGPRQVVG